MEPFAEEPARVRPGGVITDGKLPAGLVPGLDMPQISLFGGIAEQGAAFLVRFGFGCFQFDLAGKWCREPVRAQMPAGEIVGGKFPDRQPSGKTSGERICRVVVLVPALEGRDPQRSGTAVGDRLAEVDRRPVQVEAQTA